jgi:hypothetical protein
MNSIGALQISNAEAAQSRGDNLLAFLVHASWLVDGWAVIIVTMSSLLLEDPL